MSNSKSVIMPSPTNGMVMLVVPMALRFPPIPFTVRFVAGVIAGLTENYLKHAPYWRDLII